MNHNLSDSGHHSPSNGGGANEVVRYLEREAAEGSEGIETANARSTSTTPMDPRLARSVSQARSEDAYSSVKLTPTSPLLPLEQLLMQQDPHDVSGSTCLHIFTRCSRLMQRDQHTLFENYSKCRISIFAFSTNICPI